MYLILKINKNSSSNKKAPPTDKRKPCKTVSCVTAAIENNLLPPAMSQ